MTREELAEAGDYIFLEFSHFYKNQFTYVGNHLGKRLTFGVKAEYRDELSSVESAYTLLQMDVVYLMYGDVEL